MNLVQCTMFISLNKEYLLCNFRFLKKLTFYQNRPSIRFYRFLQLVTKPYLQKDTTTNNNNHQIALRLLPVRC